MSDGGTTMEKQEIKDDVKMLKERLAILEKKLDEPEKWIPEKPTLCWVWDGVENTKKFVSIIVSYQEDGYKSCTSSRSYSSLWRNAIPMTHEEMLSLLDKPNEYYGWRIAPDSNSSEWRW